MPYVNPQHQPWSQPPLFEPDWIQIQLTINVVRGDGQMWGGLSVVDGDTGEQLCATAQAFPPGLKGLQQGVQQLLSLAGDHLENGSPFPA